LGGGDKSGVERIVSDLAIRQEAIAELNAEMASLSGDSQKLLEE